MIIADFIYYIFLSIQVSFGVEENYSTGWQQITVNSFYCSWVTNSSSGMAGMQNKAIGFYLEDIIISNGYDIVQWRNNNKIASMS